MEMIDRVDSTPVPQIVSFQRSGKKRRAPKSRLVGRNDSKTITKQLGVSPSSKRLKSRAFCTLPVLKLERTPETKNNFQNSSASQATTYATDCIDSDLDKLRSPAPLRERCALLERNDKYKSPVKKNSFSRFDDPSFLAEETAGFLETSKSNGSADSPEVSMRRLRNTGDRSGTTRCTDNSESMDSPEITESQREKKANHLYTLLANYPHVQGDCSENIDTLISISDSEISELPEKNEYSGVFSFKTHSETERDNEKKNKLKKSQLPPEIRIPYDDMSDSSERLLETLHIFPDRLSSSSIDKIIDPEIGCWAIMDHGESRVSPEPYLKTPEHNKHIFAEDLQTPKAPLKKSRNTKTIFHGVLSQNHIEIKDAILLFNEDPNSPLSVLENNEVGEILPLLLAAKISNSLVIETLLDHGAAVNSVNCLGQTALHILCFRAKESQASLSRSDKDTILPREKHSTLSKGEEARLQDPVHTTSQTDAKGRPVVNETSEDRPEDRGSTESVKSSEQNTEVYPEHEINASELSEENSVPPLWLSLKEFLDNLKTIDSPDSGRVNACFSAETQENDQEVQDPGTPVAIEPQNIESKRAKPVRAWMAEEESMDSNFDEKETLESMELLIKKGIDTSKKDFSGKTALDYSKDFNLNARVGRVLAKKRVERIYPGSLTNSMSESTFPGRDKLVSAGAEVVSIDTQRKRVSTTIFSDITVSKKPTRNPEINPKSLLPGFPNLV